MHLLQLFNGIITGVKLFRVHGNSDIQQYSNSKNQVMCFSLDLYHFTQIFIY